MTEFRESGCQNLENSQGVLNELLAKGRREYISPYHAAMAQLAVGDTGRAFAGLDSAYAARDPLLTMNSYDRSWDPVRSDPRFVRLRA